MPREMLTPPTSPGTPTDRLTAFFDTSQPCDIFDDTQIEEIAFLLARSGHCAQNAPRTYIVLRSIGRLEVLEQLLQAGFGDGWFPVEARSLPGFLEPRVRADIVQNQRLVLTKASNLEKGRHCHFGSGDSLPFTTLARLGSGAFGTVTKIESTITFRQYALKTIRRRAAFGEQSKRAMGEILSEMRIMQSLQHDHIVRYVGSFTNKNSFGILMLPVADQDLAAYLQDAATEPRKYPTVRTFFGCLATALSFLHDNEVKHRDIKPQNVLMYQSKVLLTDFGLSRDYMDTSSGLTPASPRYCAPEVAAHESRNTSADVWSLACVFLEILATLRGLDVEWLKEYYNGFGDGSTHFHANPSATESLLQDWMTFSRSDTQPLAWTKDMLKLHRNARPSAAEVAQKIMASDDKVGFMYSCSSCYESESDSDSISSIVEKLDVDYKFPIMPRHPAPKLSMAQLTPVATQDSDTTPAIETPPRFSTPPTVTTVTSEGGTQDGQSTSHPEPRGEGLDLSTTKRPSIESTTTASSLKPYADRSSLPVQDVSNLQSRSTYPAPNLPFDLPTVPAIIVPALTPISPPPNSETAQHSEPDKDTKIDHLEGLRKEMQLAWGTQDGARTSNNNLLDVLHKESKTNNQDRPLNSTHNIQHLWAFPGVLDSYYGPESSSYISPRLSGELLEIPLMLPTAESLSIERKTGTPDPEHLVSQPPPLDGVQFIAEYERSAHAGRERKQSPQRELRLAGNVNQKDEDGDNPLGMLHKQHEGKDSRPSPNSIAQQELEDTEPLSRRRERSMGAINARKRAAAPGPSNLTAELEAPVEEAHPLTLKTSATTSKARVPKPESQMNPRPSHTVTTPSREGDTGLPFAIPTASTTEPSTVPYAHTSFAEDRKSKAAKPRATGTRVFDVDPCVSVQYAAYDISQIPFFVDNEVITISGQVPFVFGKCIEVILQSQSTYTDKHTWRPDISFSDCLGFEKHRVTPNAVQVLLAAFEGSPDYGQDFDWYGCKASDVARFLQTYLVSLPEPLLPVELSKTLPELKECHGRLLIPAHRGELQVYTQCLQKLKEESDTNYRMLLCLIAFLATYADLGRGSERLPHQNLWIQRAARPYSLPCIIPCDPVLPTMCLLTASARHFLGIESGQPISDSKWTAIVNKGKTASDLPAGYEVGKRKLVSWQKTTDREVSEEPQVVKRGSRGFMKMTADVWKGRKKKGES